MATIRYTKDHEYVRVDGETGRVGITDFAQSQLGDIVFVELPKLGKRLMQGDEAAVVESVKAASEVKAPVSGEVVAVNEALEATPALVNSDAAGAGWFLELRLFAPAELESLMDAAAYRGFVDSLG
jgi:glycine cleavage system H protein